MALIETYRPGSEGQDTSVHSDRPALAEGGAELLEVARIGTVEARAFLRFELPLRPGWDVVNAILRITVTDVIASADPQVSLVQAHRVGAAWDEARTTWNDQPPVTGPALSSITVSTPGVYTFGVANAVDAWNAGQVNSGLRLAYAPGGDAYDVIFLSSDSLDPNGRPFLQVIWAAKAPNAPITQVEGFPANETAVLSWTFSHDDPNAVQSAFQVEILDATDGTPVFLVSKTAGAAQQVTIAANTLANGGQYQMRVKTWGPEDVEGPWSAYDLFVTAARPVAALTAPTGGQVVTTSSFLVTWSYTDSLPQAQYRLRLYELPSGVLAMDSGVVNSALTSHPISRLKDVTSYRLELTVWNSVGIASAVDAALNFSVDTVPPPAPVVVGIADGEAGLIRLEITTVAPGLGQVATDHNEVWRRSLVQDWVQVAAALAPSADFADPTAAAGTAYDYRVVAVSVVDTSAETQVSLTLSLFGVWLSEVDNAESMIHLHYDGALGRNEQWTPEVELLRFAGRTGAVAEFGPQMVADFLDVSVQLPSGESDRALLQALVRRRQVVCYRDGQNRKLFGVISNLAITDQAYGGSANFRVDTVDHIETGS